MQTKTDISYGVIPFFKKDEQWKVFLIEEISWTGNIFWTFPKGHPEAGETPEVAARRELHEETGITLAELRTETPFVQSYTFMHGNVEIKKTVEYFIGIATSQDFVIQASEVRSARWYSIESAAEQLTYDSAREVLIAAYKQLC